MTERPAGMRSSARKKIERRLARVREALLPDDMDPTWVRKMIERTMRQAGASERATQQATDDLLRLLSRDIADLLVAARFCPRPHADKVASDGGAYDVVRDALVRYTTEPYGDLALNAERAAAMAITVLAATGYVATPEKKTGESSQSA